MNISFNKKQEQYIAEQVESGNFPDAGEVIRDALRLHELYRHHSLQDLRNEIEKGWEGAVSSRSVKDIILSLKQNRHDNV